MRDAPKTLWAYGVLSVGVYLAYLVLGVPGGEDLEISADGWAILLASLTVLMVLLLILLLRGSRIAWALLAVFGVLGLVSAPFDGQPWWAISIEAVLLACLAAPASWRFVWRRPLGPVPAEPIPDT